MMQNLSRSPSPSYSRSTSFNRRSSLEIGSPTSASNSQSFSGFSIRSLLVLAIVVTSLVAISVGYSLVLPSLKNTFHLDNGSEGKSNSSVGDCDVFYGNWVQDRDYPLYNATECPFAERGFNCLGNGKKDAEYLKWRWKPKHCDMPKFHASTALEWLRNKRVVFVGDSMSRTQWESLICFLMTGVEDKKSVSEVNGSKITKQIRFLGVRFSSFNFTVEFFRSVFLVQHNWLPRDAPLHIRSTLMLDKLDNVSSRWIDSDVLIFNTGQWWVPEKIFHLGCFFQVGDSLKLEMSITTAFRTALNTLASWVDKSIDRKRTKVFIRTFEPSHWSNQSRTFCNETKYPSQEPGGRDQSIFSDIIIETAHLMTEPITVLNITSMSAFRSDAHVGFRVDKPYAPDCSHWCLPGVPDMWNEILLSYLIRGVRFFPIH